jgi:flagellar biosynthesis protein FlhA
MASAATTTDTPLGFLRGIRYRDLILPMGIVSIIGLMIVPLPTLFLDLLLAVNITLAIVILLTAIQVRRALDFSVFPSLLLITTLFRLALNVSTTRLILLNGAEGEAAAGEIVATFGSFVVGGSYVVGIVVFLILTLINFIVITRGSGRIAEVSARFTLDALPGKQMSIDSDLAAGLITQDDARSRRKTLSLETDFYGAMDGASKFVRGDAIAGLVITAINIIGGLVIGVLQLDMTMGEAATTYTVLTIGDGLVTQIPTLLVSTAAGMVVTQAADDTELGARLHFQLLGRPKVLLATAMMLALLALIPGMPALLLLGIAGFLFYMARKRLIEGDLAPPDTGSDAQSGEPGAESAPKNVENEIEDMLPMEILELEVGFGLVPLVDTREGGDVIKRINRLRQNFARDMGLILPPVHIRDNLELAPGGYRLLVHGVEVAEGAVMVDRMLAMDPGDVRDKVDGINTIEPAFGLPALWIRSSDKSRAELAGYTVVESAAVIITHLSEVLQRESEQLLGREQLQHLLDVVARRNPRIVDELVPSVLSHAELQAVLRAMLRERVSIRDLSTILETLSECSRYGKSIPFLVDQVRARLGSSIVQRLLGGDGKLHVAILSPGTEDALRSTMLRTDVDVNLAPDLGTAQRLLAEIQEAMDNLHGHGHSAVLLVPTDIRFALFRFVSRFLNQVQVLGQNELPGRVELITDYTVDALEDASAARATRGPAA